MEELARLLAVLPPAPRAGWRRRRSCRACTPSSTAWSPAPSRMPSSAPGSSPTSSRRSRSRASAPLRASSPKLVAGSEPEPHLNPRRGRDLRRRRARRARLGRPSRGRRVCGSADREPSPRRSSARRRARRRDRRRRRRRSRCRTASSGSRRPTPTCSQPPARRSSRGTNREPGERRDFALGQALRNASEVPTAIAETCADVAQLAAAEHESVEPDFAADVAAAAILAAGAAQAAASLVAVNLLAHDNEDDVVAARRAATTAAEVVARLAAP